MLLTIHDESPTGAVTHELTLDVLMETLTVRDLIRSRVYQEVDDHNCRVRLSHTAATPDNGLVTPTKTERDLNGLRAGKTFAKEIDWKKQFDAACEAFTRNGFFILVDDKQAEDLDETVVLKSDTRVSFVKLVPLVGG